MSQKQNNQKSAENSGLETLKTIKSYLDQDEMRYHTLADDAVELYMQGNNLTMHLLIYYHNGHLIFRIPAFIRNVELRRLDVLLFIMEVTNEILDIRFEIGKDGKSLSACCQHIIEDGRITRKQFDLAMMVLMHMVDDTFPRFMQIIYGHEQPDEMTDIPDTDISVGSENDSEQDSSEDFAPLIDEEEDDRKIN